MKTNPQMTQITEIKRNHVSRPMGGARNNGTVYHSTPRSCLLCFLNRRNLRNLRILRILILENYFNYFTEIEERFQRCRGTRMLLSPLDWALIESWKEGGLPLEAVLTGIERSFEKFRQRPPRFQKVNSVAYCSQEVLRAAQDASLAETQGGAPAAQARPELPPFPIEEILAFFSRNAEALDRAAQRAAETGQPIVSQDLAESARVLRETAAKENLAAGADFQELDRRLTALEEKLEASLKRAASVDLLAEISREVDRGLVPYRRKMTAPQIESLERQFTKRVLFERYQIPRLSLFYL
jgi:hypothetical protein